MSKAIKKYDDYKFILGDELKVMAENELRETCATRDFALQAVREWIEANPRIHAARLGKLILLQCIVIKSLKSNYISYSSFQKKNVDASFLLRFLRAKKFSVPITCEGIERYLLLRQSYEFFNNLDMNLPIMKILLDAG